MRRDAVVPIDDRLAAAAATQQQLGRDHTVEANLLTIITSLEQPADGSSGCCSSGDERKGCACRDQQGRSDAS